MFIEKHWRKWSVCRCIQFVIASDLVLQLFVDNVRLIYVKYQWFLLKSFSEFQNKNPFLLFCLYFVLQRLHYCFEFPGCVNIWSFFFFFQSVCDGNCRCSAGQQGAHTSLMIDSWLLAWFLSNKWPLLWTLTRVHMSTQHRGGYILEITTSNPLYLCPFSSHSYYSFWILNHNPGLCPWVSILHKRPRTSLQVMLFFF